MVAFRLLALAGYAEACRCRVDAPFERHCSYLVSPMKNPAQWRGCGSSKSGMGARLSRLLMMRSCARSGFQRIARQTAMRSPTLLLRCRTCVLWLSQHLRRTRCLSSICAASRLDNFKPFSANVALQRCCIDFDFVGWCVGVHVFSPSLALAAVIALFAASMVASW